MKEWSGKRAQLLAKSKHLRLGKRAKGMVLEIFKNGSMLHIAHTHSILLWGKLPTIKAKGQIK